MKTFNAETDDQARRKAFEAQSVGRAPDFQGGTRTAGQGYIAVWQARLALFVMINVAQLWILAATVEAALASEYKQLLPLVVASGICWLIALTIFLWWKPASRRRTSTGYLRGK